MTILMRWETSILNLRKKLCRKTKMKLKKVLALSAVGMMALTGCGSHKADATTSTSQEEVTKTNQEEAAGRIVLAGVAVNTILGGIISFFSVMYSDRIQSALLWLNGSLSARTWEDVKTLSVYVAVGLVASCFLIRSANILQLGDEAAINLGVNLNLTRLIISIVAVFLAASITSVVGIISFIGLIVPHMARMLLGSDHKYTLPFSMVLGGIVLLLADTLARTIGGSIEIPVGVMMSIVGGPFFLYLLRKRGVA